MPKLLLTLPETLENVTRPVVMDVVRDMLKETGIEEGSAVYLFPGEIERGQQQGASIDKEGKDVAKFGSTTQVTIDVEEPYEQDRLLSSAIFRQEEKPVFQDDALETLLRPVYSSQDVTVTLKLRTRDGTLARRWRDDIRARVSANRDIRVHTIKYSYLLPYDYVILLKQIYDMREKVAGYGDTWGEWFRAHCSSRIGLVGNQSGGQARLAVSETQTRIVGWFDWDGVPEQGSKEDEIDTWTIGFSYRFKYDKPIAMTMYYPLMIHNQLMPQKFRPLPGEQPPKEVQDHLLSFNLSARNFEAFSSDTQQIKLRTKYIEPGFIIPEFDEFYPKNTVLNSVRVFTVLSGVDPERPRYLFNMLELGDKYTFDPSMIKLLKQEAPYMVSSKSSVLILSLYRGRDAMSDGSLYVDQNLDVWSTFDLDLREYWHVRFSLQGDWSFFTTKISDRLRQCGDGLNSVAQALNPNAPYMNIMTGNYVSRADYNATAAYVSAPYTAGGNGQSYSLHTVQTLFLESAPEPQGT